jgi:replication-associated recombination protein RarA
MPRKGGVIENLKPFVKGVSGNPKGRPVIPDLKEALAKALAEKKDGKITLEKIILALISKAIKGDVRAAQELLDRAFGKSQQFIDFTTKGDALNRIEISVDEKKTKDSFEKLINEAETHKSICTN